MSKNPVDKQALLQEYQVCSTRADQLTNLIWQTLTFFLSLSGIGLGFLGQTKIQDPSQLILITLFTVAVVWVLEWWNQVANKWNFQQNALYERLNEIEQILGFDTNRAIGRIDIENHKKLPRISALRNNLVFGVSIGWGFYLLAIARFTRSQPGFGLISDVVSFIATIAIISATLVWIKRRRFRLVSGDSNGE